MSMSSSISLSLTDALIDAQPAPPPWVAKLFDTTFEHAGAGHGQTIIERRTTASRLITVIVANVDGLDDASTQKRVEFAYDCLFARLLFGELRYAVRFWNFIPQLHRVSVRRSDAYQMFNAGRYRAFERVYGGNVKFPAAVATASAVGHSGHDLVIHCLARAAPGVPVNNPAQVRPYQYSKRYGDLPPCFARGTLIDQATLLVGGTASIVGEDSLHVGNLAAQTQQTLDNLSSLVMASGLAVERPLDTFTSLRVYHPRSGDREVLAELLGESFPAVEQIEFARAELCRAELLVEIEGTCGKAIQ